ALVSLPEERRQVTVLFADISGYTAMAELMDPEAVKTIVDRCLRRLGSEVESFGGTVDKYIGDNVMAIFGAPVAHEDDAERTVRATSGAVEYHTLEPLTLKGKAEPVPAWEVKGLTAATPRRAAGVSSAPFVGRGEELALLGSLYGRVVRESRAHLVTVVGQA